MRLFKMTNKIEIKNKSPARSFEGFDPIKLLLGQRKTVTALIAASLAYVIQDAEIITLSSGLAFAVLVECAVYFYKAK